MSPAATARVQPPETDDRLPYPENTVFLLPDLDYDKRVINLYLKQKYKGIPAQYIDSQVNSQAIPFVRDLAFVVCVRRAKEDEVPGPDHEDYEDPKSGKIRSRPIKPETYIHEVVESAPIRVGDHVKIERGTMFAPVETNLRPLIQALSDAAYPYRVSSQNKPDFMIRCTVAI